MSTTYDFSYSNFYNTLDTGALYSYINDAMSADPTNWGDGPTLTSVTMDWGSSPVDVDVTYNAELSEGQNTLLNNYVTSFIETIQVWPSIYVMGGTNTLTVDAGDGVHSWTISMTPI